MPLRLSLCVCLLEMKDAPPLFFAVLRFGEITQTHTLSLFPYLSRSRQVKCLPPAASPRVPLAPRLQTILKGGEVSRAALPKPIHNVQTPRGCLVRFPSLSPSTRRRNSVNHYDNSSAISELHKTPYPLNSNPV